MGIGAEESIGCVVSSIGNMGPGLGDTGPAYFMECPARCGQMVTVIPHVIGASGIVHRLTFVHPGILETELI